MSVFVDYAGHYDLLYRDKDYAEEARYVGGILARLAPQARTLLELGCGTGAYAECLARQGYFVDGVDLSPEMVRQSTARAGRLPQDLRERLRFVEGDARSIEMHRSYDAVVALFHVLSYQQSNADVLAFLQSVSRHLAEGGVAVFDFWYGPAVLTERPSVRVKRCEDDEIALVRIAEPVMRTSENLVDVNYELFVEDRATGRTARLVEQHVMRYFFLPELVFLLEAAGLRLLAAYRWLETATPDPGSWSACLVVRR